MKRYEEYAAEIAERIEGGALRAGDRLPSVRVASAGRGISPSTVFEAYYLLEARGLIEARPRSGYFVNARRPLAQAEPQPTPPREQTLDVEVSDLVFQVLGLARQRDVVPLGSAFPSPALFPLDKLSRSLAGASRCATWRRAAASRPPRSSSPTGRWRR